MPQLPPNSAPGSSQMRPSPELSAFAGAVILCLRALAKKGLAEQGGKPWLGKT